MQKDRFKKMQNASLQTEKNMIYYHPLRGISAAGSAQHWQCWGQEFESPMLHQTGEPFKKGSPVFYSIFFGAIPTNAIRIAAHFATPH